MDVNRYTRFIGIAVYIHAPTTARRLERVGQQVDADLSDSLGVATRTEIVVAGANRILNALRFEERRNQRLQRTDNRRNIDLPNIETDRTCLELREIENVIDQREKMTLIPANPFERTGLLCGH